MDRKDIWLHLENNVLSLRGERKFEKETKDENYHRIERSYGSFTRSFTLPESADLDKVRSDMKDGELTLVHATYAVFGRHVHKHAGRVAFVSMLALAPLGWLWHGAPSGFLYAVLLFIMLRVRHPEALDESDRLGAARTLVALATLAVFALSFTPFPLTVR